MNDTMKVYQCIAAVMADIAKEGISKDRRNQQQGYNFRGIDDVYNTLSPILSKHGLCVLPRVLGREVIERATAKGGALFYVTVEVEFDFIAAEDHSKHTVKVFGEAMDSADKATNKAMSAAYKYAAMQAFCIPTEGDNDADATTHEVAAAKPATRSSNSLKKPGADGKDAWTRLMEELKQDLLDATSKTKLDTLRTAYRTRARGEQWPAAWLSALAEQFERAEQDLLEGAHNGEAA